MSDSKESVDPLEVGQAKPSGTAERGRSRVLKIILVLGVAIYFVIAGLYLGLRYAVLPQIDAFRPRIEQLVSSKIHAQLRIGRLTSHWSGLQPVIELDNLRIDAPDGSPGLAVPHASASLSWASVFKLAPALSNLTVDGPDVIVSRATDGTIRVAGVPIPARRTNESAFTTWLLKQEHIVLRDGTLRWRDAQRTAPEIALKRIKLVVLNEGIRHRLALDAPADGDVLHGPLDFRADFRHQPFAAIGAPAHWTGRAYVSTGPVDLPTLARYVKMPFEIYSGQFDNRIWLNFAGGKLQTASGDASGGQIALRVRPTQPRLDLPVAKFGWTIEQNDNEYTLRLSDLRAEFGQPPLDDGTQLTRLLAFRTLTGTYRAASANRGQVFGVSGDRVDVGILAEFARALPLPRKVLTELLLFNPRGLVANYTLRTERAAPKSDEEAEEQRAKGEATPLKSYTVKADLQGISVQAQEPPPGLTVNNHPRAGIPGIENLWGKIDADQSQGSITIDTKIAALTIPGAFDDPRLTFDSLNGRASWTIADAPAPGEPRKAFTMRVETLHVKNADAEGEATAYYWNQGHGRGSLDLKAKVARLKVTSLVRYLPTSLSERVRIYLGHALQAGISRGGTIEVHGDLTRFPYAKFPNDGIFRIEAPFTGGKFDPTPFPPRKMRNGLPNIWPGFEGIDGKFQLAQNKLRFDIDRAHYRRVAITKTSGRIEDTGNRESLLLIDGNARGPLADMLQYVDDSSLGLMAKHATRKIRASGDATLALKLGIPRIRLPKPHVDYEGSLTFADNEVAYDTLPPLSHVRGRARFAEKTVVLDNLSGRFLGGEVRGTGGVKPDGSYALDVNGRIGTDAAQGLNMRISPQVAQVLRHVSGTAPYRMQVRGMKSALPRIEASSDLTGLGLDFPAPFAKPQGTPMPFALSFAPAAGEAGRHDASLTLGPVKAHYLVQQAGKTQFNVVRGAIGVNKPADLPSQGVAANIELDELDADAWRRLFAELSPPPAPGTARAPAPKPPMSENVRQFIPTRVALHLTTLKLLNRRWENVVIGASESERKWQANIASNQVSGYVSWTPGATRDSPGALQARFAQVVIPEKAENELVGPMIRRPPRNMPTIDLIVNEVVMRGRTLGRLEVDASNGVENGLPVWRLDKFEFANPDATLSATANWRALSATDDDADDNAPRRTALDFKLDVKDAGALLDRFGLPRTVNAGKGSMSGKAAWIGSPTVPDLPSLNGELAVDLRHGQILKVNAGAAKLLGVLSLQSLAHLLTLNFQDVVGRGLPFEKITGTAKIEDGIGRTDDFTMVTSPARVELKGLVNLPTQSQDLHARVIPTVSAGAVALGAAVINPLLGLGTLAADLVLSKSIGKAFARDYAITGTWSKPVIQRVKGDQGKIETPAAAVTD
ncbi:YhdP family phospholipid transporter [Caballeronia telluris]|uniref:YhdP central domain-containing protein n=1 Tax=Caballeronia telluris TaxID=326475 RepID=A0A158K5X3_9BURK|nr:AsmA-like C-terminal region-containing protein [Caballeronia telluris]SAL75851.1 hypothetical protein AWB66_05278 [Caballeronia telluris]